MSMGRLEELSKKFPEIPRSIIIKSDVLREGIKFTPILNKIGRWALPQSHAVYEFDHEDHHTAEESSEGWSFIPYSFELGDGTATMVQIDSNSPYEITEEEDGRYMLYRDGELVEEIFFSPRPEWYSKRTKDETLMSNISFKTGRCRSFNVMVLNYCEYFKTDDQCKYCSLIPTSDRAKELGIKRKIRKEADRVAEVFSAAVEKEGGIDHCLLTGGSMINRTKEAERYIPVLEAIKNTKEYKTDIPIYIVLQAVEKNDARRLHDAGANIIGFNFEVWEEKLWPIVVPGKAKFVGRENWIKSLVEAVEIFGRGNVVTGFVAGSELVPPHGFKTIDEALKSTLGGFEWLLQHGITPRFNTWTPNPGSKYEKMNLPPTEYYLGLGLGRYKLMLEYDMYMAKCYCHKCRNIGFCYDFPRLTSL